MSDIAKIQKALQDLRADLLERAEQDSDGKKVVNVSNGRWVAFNEALRLFDKMFAEGMVTVRAEDLRKVLPMVEIPPPHSDRPEEIVRHAKCYAGHPDAMRRLEQALKDQS